MVEINEVLGGAPEEINGDPYGKGWMIHLRVRDASETSNLMTAQEYDDYTKEEA